MYINRSSIASRSSIKVVEMNLYEGVHVCTYGVVGSEEQHFVAFLQRDKSETEPFSESQFLVLKLSDIFFQGFGRHNQHFIQINFLCVFCRHTADAPMD